MIGGDIGKPIGGVIWLEGLPLGIVQYDLPVAHLIRVPETNLKTWTWKYNQNLIGQDKFPTGRRFDWYVTPAPQRAENLKTWTWQYNLNLIGQDRLPVGEISLGLTTRRLGEGQTFIGAFRRLLQVEAAPFNQPYWALPIVLPRRTNDLLQNTTLFMPPPPVSGKLMGQIWM